MGDRLVRPEVAALYGSIVASMLSRGYKIDTSTGTRTHEEVIDILDDLVFRSTHRAATSAQKIYARPARVVENLFKGLDEGSKKVLDVYLMIFDAFVPI
jgi:hypothetical protein